ncbi:hypothetical protein Emed_004048 [Eimeria media]
MMSQASLPSAAAGPQEPQDATKKLTDESSVLSSSAKTDFTGKHAKTELAVHKAYRRWHPRSQPSARVLTAILALLLAGFLLTVICKRPRSKGLSAGTSTRRLAQSSEGEGESNEELEFVLQGCLEFEKEYGFSGFFPEAEVEEPAAKKARIVSFIDKAVREYQGAVHPVPSEVQTSTSITAVEQQAATTTASVEQEEYEESFAFLLSRYLGSPQSLPQDTESSLEQNLDSEKWLENIPSILEEEEGSPTDVEFERTEEPVFAELLTAKSGSERESTPSSDADFSSLMVVEGEAPSSSASASAHGQTAGVEGEGEKALEGEPSDAGPSGSAAAQPASDGEGSEEDTSGDYGEHPFTRLPVLLPGALKRSFIPGQYRAQYAVSFSILYLLKIIRKHYLKPVLDEEDAEDLLSALETLVYISRGRLKPGEKSTTPSHLVETFATYFMVYDTLVCGIEIFGSKMNLGLWWEDFISMHKTDYSGEPRRNKFGGPSFYFHMRFIDEASAALAIYKTGVRPPKREIIRLKRMIFCHEFSPRRFKGDRGKPWRQDDERYVSTHPEFSEYSEEERKAAASYYPRGFQSFPR